MVRSTARTSRSGRKLSQAYGVIGGTVLLFLLPALLDVLSDPARAYGYLAPDAFYYFTIAANWVDYGAPSFDQVHPTNGFHPLWQWLVTLLYAGLQGLGFSRLALVPVAVVACLVATSAAIVMLGLVLENKGRLSPLFFLLPVGVWPLLASPLWWLHRDAISPYQLPPLFNTLWNYSNGMESAPLLLAFAWVAWLYVKRPANGVPRAVLFGLALGTLSLARLDHAVFAFVFVGLPLARSLIARDRERIALEAWSLLTWLAVLMAYLVYNWAVVGRLMPISGAVKSTFPHPASGSLDWLFGLITTPPRNLLYGVGRIACIAFTAAAALLYFPFALRLRAGSGRVRLALREGHGRFSELMSLTAVGILALAVYDVLFVVGWHVGEWYVPVSVLFVSLFAVQVSDRVALAWRPSWGRALGFGVAVLSCGVGLAYFWHLHRVPHWGKIYADFCLVKAPRVVAHYAGAPPKLLSREDGAIAFATGFPTTSGTRLALDAEAAQADTRGAFEKLLEERGVDRVTSLYYAHARGLRVGERSARVQAYARRVLQDPPRRKYEAEYVDGTFGIMRAREPGPGK